MQESFQNWSQLCKGTRSKDWKWERPDPDLAFNAANDVSFASVTIVDPWTGASTHTVWPPSMILACPTTNAAESDLRQTTAAEPSPGLPARERLPGFRRNKQAAVAVVHGIV